MHRVPRSRFIGLLIVLSSTSATLLAEVPLEVTDLTWCPGQRDCLQWSPAPNAERYDVYRGELPDFRCTTNASPDSCRRLFTGNSTGPGAISEVPASGQLFWFLVTAENASGEGPSGAGSTGPRQTNAMGPCGGTCLSSGSMCTSGAECCSGSCPGGYCKATCCDDAGPCESSATCCAGICYGGSCYDLCLDIGGPCYRDDQCCTGMVCGAESLGCCLADGAQTSSCFGCCHACDPLVTNSCGSGCVPSGFDCTSTYQCCGRSVCLQGHCQ